MRVAVVHHHTHGYVRNLVCELEERGHQTRHIPDKDVPVALGHLLRFGPDTVILDMFHEVKRDCEAQRDDPISTPPADSWGGTILLSLRGYEREHKLKSARVIVLSRFWRKDVHDFLDHLGVAREDRGDPLDWPTGDLADYV